MAQKTIIEGTSYEIKRGRTLIDGTGYSITKGRTLREGTGYDIAFIQIINSVPSQSGILTYTGGALTPSWSNYDSTKMTIGGTTSGTNAGTYTATFTPKNGYCWSDGSVDTKSVTWIINKANGTISINKTNLTFTSGTSQTITVTLSGGGSATASSSSSSVATVSCSGTTVTVKPAGDGNATITISGSSANYTYGSKTCSVNCSLPKYTINFAGTYEGDSSNCYVLINGTKYAVPWSSRSLEQVYDPNYGMIYDYVYTYHKITVTAGTKITLRAYGTCTWTLVNVPGGSNISAGSSGTIPSLVRKRTGTSSNSYTTLVQNGSTTYTVNGNINIQFDQTQMASNEYVNSSGKSYTLTITER